MLKGTPPSRAVVRPLVLSRVLPLRALLVYREEPSALVYVPWLLARAGVEADVVAPPGHPVLSSKCVRQTWAVRPAPAEVRDTVASRLAGGAYGMLLLMDQPSRAAFYSGEIDPVVAPYLPLPRDAGAVDLFASPEAVRTWCERHALPVPPIVRTRTAEEAIALAREWDDPVLMKVAGAQKEGRVCRSYPDVRAAFADWGTSGRVEAHRLLRGATGSTVFVALRGELGAWAAAEDVYCGSRGLGTPVVRRMRNDPELGRLAAKIAAAAQVSGIMEFTWGEGAPGEFFVTDVRFGRCAPSALLAAIVGVDLGRAVRDLLEAKERCQAPSRNHGRVVAMSLSCLEQAVRGELWPWLRRANPCAGNVSYFLGPWAEARMTGRIAGQAFMKGARELRARFRRRRTVELLPLAAEREAGARAMLAPAEAGQVRLA